MKSDKWRIVVLLSVSIIPLSARGQSREAPDLSQHFQVAAEGIANQNPEHQASAAELIARYRFAALYPELLRAFHELAPSAAAPFTGSPQQLAMEALAGALIQLKVRVPSHDSRRLYPVYPALAMILLSQASDDNRADLLSILQETDVGEIWLAAADLLAQRPTPEFVAQLVNGFSMWVRILVAERGIGGGMSDGDCYSSAQAPSKIGTPAGWPIFTTYSLQLARDGGTPFAPGTDAISYSTSTTLHASPQPWTGRSGCGGLDLQNLRRDVMMQLSGVDPKTANLNAVVLRDVVNKNDQQCQKAIVDILKEQLVSFNHIVAALRSRDLLPRSQASLPLHMQVWIVSYGDRHPLPQLPSLADLGIVGEYHHP